jgi:hypothetical protein
MVIQQPNGKRREVSLEEAARLVGADRFPVVSQPRGSDEENAFDPAEIDEPSFQQMQQSGGM